MLVGPVFLAGSMTSERERQTLDLLLTTVLTPFQILSGKFVVGFRISAVLTSFLLWPLVLGTMLNRVFYSNWASVLGMFAIVLMVCVVNATIALVCSLYQKKTSIALLSTYSVLLILYVGPPAAIALMTILDFDPAKIASAEWFGVTSPFSALFSLPLDSQMKQEYDDKPANVGDLRIVFGYFVFSAGLLFVSAIAMFARLKSRLGLSE